MFFTLSKIFWFLINPVVIAAATVIIGTGLLWTKRFQRLGRGLLTGFCVVAGLFSVLPIAEWPVTYLENRFPIPETIAEPIHGIIVLGGEIDPAISEARGRTNIGGGARITAFVELARKFPDAVLIYSGGSGRLDAPDQREADYVKPILVNLGLDPQRPIIFERESRNTWQNATLSLAAAKPGADERWILITSASHLPRAVGCFRAAGWPEMIPFPAAFSTTGEYRLSLGWHPLQGLHRIGQSLHEWIGLLVYRLTGRSSAFFPAPANPRQQE